MVTACACDIAMILPIFCPNFCRSVQHKDDWGNTVDVGLIVYREKRH